MDVDVAHACKASELARRLSDTELFLLIESESFSKTADQRAFAHALFLSISIVKRVGERRNVEKAIDGLLAKGFLGHLGARLVHATQDGNLVKHAFRTVRAAMSLSGADAANLRSVHFCATLRKEMALICKRQDKN